MTTGTRGRVGTEDHEDPGSGRYRGPQGLGVGSVERTTGDQGLGRYRDHGYPGLGR